MVGKLARYLRMCGHDTAYALDRGVEDADEVQAWAEREGRTLLTRNRALAARAGDSILVDGLEIDEQLRAVREAGITLELTEPARCADCNGRLEPVVNGEPTPEYAPATGEQPVWRCPDCGKHFWKGSHWEDVRERLARLRST